MPLSTIHVPANSEDEGGDSMVIKSFGYVEILARLAGMYFDPRGHHTVLKWKLGKMKLLNFISSFDMFIYLTAFCVWSIKTLLLVTQTDGFSEGKLLVLCFFIQYFWMFIFGLVMGFLLPKRLPLIFQEINTVCSDACRTAMLLMLIILTFMLLSGTSIIIYAHRSMYRTVTDTTLAFSDSIRLYPFEIGTPEGGFLAVIYTCISIMAMIGVVFTASLMFMVCVILGREFSGITSCLSVILEDKSHQDLDTDSKSKKLEGLRQQYERVYAVVSQADGVIKYTALIGFFFGILVFCFTLYCIGRGELDPAENGTILILMVVSVSQILTYTITGCYLSDKAHSSRDILLKFDVTDMKENSFRTIHLFLARVTGAPIGVTMFGIFTIDRTSTLTVFGTILSYAVLVLQLNPSSSDTNCPCYNVTAFQDVCGFV